MIEHINDPTNPREREYALLNTVRAERMEPGMRALTMLLAERLAKLDMRLRRCSREDFQQLQAEAFTYEKLLAEINA